MGWAQRTEGWSFEVTPRLWYAGLKGEVTVKGRKVDFEKDPRDRFDPVEAGGSFRIGAENERFLASVRVIRIWPASCSAIPVPDHRDGGRA